MYLQDNNLNLKTGILNIITKNLKFIDLSNNKLEEICFDVLMKLDKAQVFNELKLIGNQLKCSCENVELFVEMVNTKKISYDLKEDDRCFTTKNYCSTKSVLSVVACISSAVILLLIGIIITVHYVQEIKVWLYAHNACVCLVTEEVLDKDEMYDAFVSISYTDRKFLDEELIPNLENVSPNFKLCIYYRDWIIGEIVLEQVYLI